MFRTPSPNVRRRRLGAELRRLREAAGLTGDQVVERVGWASTSKISRIENGRSRPDLADVLALLDLYRVTGRRREQLLAIARDEALADQLEHLCRLADLPNVTLRLLPPHAAIGDWYTPATSFSIYQFTDPDDPGTVGVEALGHDVLLSDHPALREYLRVFDWLREAARPVEESRRWLTEAAAAARAAATSSPSPDGETAGPGRQTGGGDTAGRGGPHPGGEPAGRGGADRHAAGGEPAARGAAAPAQRGPHRRRVEPRPG